ncbi:hypothetical protein PZH33_19660, partial [Blautia schinkii]|uniref:hypothetical protein n=1 Tax=Blautia schinkii TaxID=180164 RepID=UPI0023B08244
IRFLKSKIQRHGSCTGVLKRNRGIFMDKLCFSIDEERYDDIHGHVLSLVGWYMHPEKKKCIFQLLGDGYEVIDIP